MVGYASAEAQSKEKKRQDQKKAEIAEQICREYESLAADRGNWDSHWLEISERVIPNHRNIFRARGMDLTTKGEKRTEELFDSTAAIGLGRFSAILDSMLTPRNQRWHTVTTNNRDLNKLREVKLYYDEVTQTLFKYRYSPRANFSSQNQQNFKSLGAYGTGAVFIDRLQMGRERGLRYKNTHLGEIYLAENHQGIVDKVLRYFAMTARQAVQKWPNTVPTRIKEVLKTTPEREFFFIHCVKPRQDLDPTKLDYRGMPYVSYYISVEGKAFLSESGYTSFPYAVSRYEQHTGEVYGRSPAMDVLPAIKTLNEEKKTILKQGHRIVDPVLLTHDDGIVDTFSLKPGAINAGGVTADGRSLVQALPVGNIAIGKELMDDERSVINDAFLVTLFQILMETPTMTATEVLERTREKGILLAPTVGRQHSEYLGPMIERELDVLAEQGLLPEMPEVLREAKGEYEIQYTSPLARAARAEEASGLMRTVETALNIVNVTQDPAPLDHFDWDMIIPDISEIQGVPARWMKDKRVIDAIRADRAEQQQTQQMIQAGPSAAAMVKAVGSVQKG